MSERLASNRLGNPHGTEPKGLDLGDGFLRLAGGLRIERPCPNSQRS